MALPHKSSDEAAVPYVREPASQTEWDALYDLRWRVLRAPWDQPRGSERDEWESSAIHLVALDSDKRVVGTGRVHLVTPETAQIRYMAVDPASRGLGLGAAILRELESRAAASGAVEIRLNARLDVVPFYARAGYGTLGEAPTLFGMIEHRLMGKALSP